jgi:hypothetical protein
MIMALTRVAFAVATTSLRIEELSRTITPTSYLTDAEKILLEKVNFKDIEQAINTNDYELARANYEKSLKPLMEQTVNFNNIGLDAAKLDNFEFFLQKIREAELAGNPNPLTAWFKEDPYTDWENYAMGSGWESFLAGAVQKARLGGLSIGGVLNAPLDQTLTITYTPAVSIASHQQGGAMNANDSTM